MFYGGDRELHLLYNTHYRSQEMKMEKNNISKFYNRKLDGRWGR